jgi:hypothetical protein
MEMNQWNHRVVAHNLKAAGSNPAPATKNTKQYQRHERQLTGQFLFICFPHQRHINDWRGPLKGGDYSDLAGLMTLPHLGLERYRRTERRLWILSFDIF